MDSDRDRDSDRDNLGGRTHLFHDMNFLYDIIHVIARNEAIWGCGTVYQSMRLLRTSQ